MTRERAKETLQWAVLTAALSVGIAWGTTSYRLGAVEQRLERIDKRVGAMYCAQVPVNLKDACQ